MELGGVLDPPPVRAVVTRRRSLLPAGITAVSGRFYGGDVVSLLGPEDRPVARGVVAYDSAEISDILGKSTQELPAEMQRPVVHADDLVPL